MMMMKIAIMKTKMIIDVNTDDAYASITLYS